MIVQGTPCQTLVCPAEIFHYHHQNRFHLEAASLPNVINRLKIAGNRLWYIMKRRMEFENCGKPPFPQLAMIGALNFTSEPTGVNSTLQEMLSRWRNPPLYTLDSVEIHNCYHLQYQSAVWKDNTRRSCHKPWFATLESSTTCANTMEATSQLFSTEEML